TIRAGTPSARIVAPLNSASPSRTPSNSFTTMSCCPANSSTTSPARRPSLSITITCVVPFALTSIASGSPTMSRNWSSGTTSSRSSITSRPCTRRREACARSTVSCTCVIGTAYISPSTRASSARTIASVTGRRSVTVVPSPGAVRISTAPPSARTRVNENLVAIDPAAVVLHAHRHHLPFARDRERELPRALLPRAHSVVRLLDAVVRSVAQQVNDRLADLVEHRAIELDLAANQRELDLLAERVRGVADETRETVEHLANRHHAARHDLLVQLGDEPRRLRQRLVERGIGDLVRDVGEPVARDEQLAREIHEAIEPLQLHAHGARRAVRNVRARQLHLRGKGRDVAHRRVRANARERL